MAIPPAFKGILSWVLGVAVLVVAVLILVINVITATIIENAAAENRHAEFQRVAETMSRLIGASGGIHDVKALSEAFRDILDLRPGIRRLDLFEILPISAPLILSTNPENAPQVLEADVAKEIAAGHATSRFDGTSGERAWIIVAPITVNGEVIGALRGRFSISKFDRLIQQEQRWILYVSAAAVAITCLVFVVLIRLKVHEPITQLLNAMRRAEEGDLEVRAPVVGPHDIQVLALQFNWLLSQVREVLTEKHRLLQEVENFNETLVKRVADATAELRRANIRLMEARLQAERAEKLAALGELSAVMAHELGTPLSAVLGHLQMMKGDDDRQDQDRRLDIIQMELNRMVGIIRQILDSTRVEVRPAPVDLNEIVGETVALITPGLVERDVNVKMELDPSLPLVAADRLSLQGLLSNLMMNAIQAMPGGGELILRTCSVAGQAPEGKVILAGSPELAGEGVRLVVSDTGRGIAPEHLEAIFEPFFTTRQEEGGTGLGLAITRRIVASYGGQLAVRSSLGCGTMFTIDLPTWKEEGAIEA
jgi:signal transduction histidine kinase